VSVLTRESTLCPVIAVRHALILEEQSQTKQLDHLLVEPIICVYDLSYREHIHSVKTNSTKYAYGILCNLFLQSGGDFKLTSIL
jgi:hypothetical protein